MNPWKKPSTKQGLPRHLPNQSNPIKVLNRFGLPSANSGNQLWQWKIGNSPPARWGLLDFIRAVLLILLLLLLLLHLLLFLLLQFLLDHVCINFHVYFRLANSSPISSPTSARSGHCWTSTAGFRSEWARLDLNRQVPSAVGTAGPQPGTFRAQWAALDLNLGPSR